MAGYAMNIKLNGSLDEVKGKVTQALKTQGFGILTEIDMQKALKNKLGVDYKPYLILGACNPNFAHKALEIDDNIGLLLPCNVVLKQEQDGVVVGIIDPVEMFSVVDEPTRQAMSGFPQEVKRVLQSALDELAAQG